MTIRHKADMRGFTMIEVIIALFLVAVALTGLASMTAMVLKGNAVNKMSTTATALASDTMEDLKSRTSADSRLAAGLHSDAGNPIYGLYARSWNVSDVTDAANANVMYKTITLTVTWNWLNKSRSVSLTGLKANSS